MIELLPWSELPRADSLFVASGHCEGLRGWYQAVAETTLKTGETAVIVAATRSGAVVGALPAVSGATGLRGLTAPYTTRYTPALPDVDVAYNMGRQARAVAGGVFRLDAVDPADPGIMAFLKGLGESLAVAPYHAFANWTEPVTDFASYWKRRPSRLRTTVRRKQAAVDAVFTFVRSDFDAALAQYEDIQRASWKGPEPYPDFLAAMVRRMAPVVRMGLLEIGGRTVAAQIWLVHGGRATIFKLVHRADAADMSPGTLLTRQMIETCLREDSVSVLDFGRGDDAYKRDWMGTRAMRLGIIAADWRCTKGLRAIAAEVLPTLAGRAWRRHFGGNRSGSAAASPGETLAEEADRRKVTAAEALS